MHDVNLQQEHLPVHVQRTRRPVVASLSKHKISQIHFSLQTSVACSTEGRVPQQRTFSRQACAPTPLSLCDPSGSETAPTCICTGGVRLPTLTKEGGADVQFIWQTTVVITIDAQPFRPRVSLKLHSDAGQRTKAHLISSVNSKAVVRALLIDTVHPY